MSKAEEEQKYQDQLNAAGKNFDDFIEKSMGKTMTPEQKAVANKLFDQFINITEGNKTELSSVMKELASATGLSKQAIISATEKLWPIHANDQTKKDLVLDGFEPIYQEVTQATEQVNQSGENFDDFLEKKLGKSMTPEQRAAANKLFDKFINITEGNKDELSSAMKELVSATGLSKQAVIEATEKLWPIHANDPVKKDIVLGGLEPFFKEIESIALSLKNDASFSNRANSYRQSLEAVGYSETEKKVQHLNGTLSVIEGLAGKIIYSTQTPEKVAELTEALIQNRDACLEIMTDQREKDKLILAIARNEAVMKGFGMPLDATGAPYSELDKFGLTEEMQAKVVAAIKQSLKDNCGKKLDDVPPGTYSKKILDDVQKNLEAQGISGADLENCMKFAGNGKDKKRDYTQKYGINQEQVQDIATAATNSINTLIDTAKKDTEIINGSMKQAHTVLDAAIEELNKSGYKVSPERYKKITDKLFSQVRGLGEEYLKTNGQNISHEIAEGLKQKKSFSAMFTSDYTISSESLEKIGKKVIERHLAKASKVQEETVIQMVSKFNLKESTLIARTDHFYKMSGQNTKITTHPSTSELAQMRLKNPKLFDQVFNRPVAPPMKVVTVSAKIGDDINHGHAAESIGKSEAVDMGAGRKRGTAVTEKPITTDKDKPVKPPKQSSGWVH